MKTFFLKILIFTLTLIIFSEYSFSQEAVVIKNYDGKKYPETVWGPDNKHFSYYQVRYLTAIPGITTDGIYSPLISGTFEAGYVYRYKIIDNLDVGMEIAYGNVSTRIKNDYHHKFSEDTVHNFDCIRTYNNNIHLSAFGRYVFKDNNIRNLGWHVDVGGFFNYAISSGVRKKLNTDDLELKIRNKNPDFLENTDYGIFIRIGKNYMSFYANYSFTDWITDYNGKDYLRTPISAGIQLNLYAR